MKKFYCPTCKKFKRRIDVKKVDDCRCYWYTCRWCHQDVKYSESVLEELLADMN